MRYVKVKTLSIRVPVFEIPGDGPIQKKLVKTSPCHHQYHNQRLVFSKETCQGAVITKMSQPEEVIRSIFEAKINIVMHNATSLAT